jgi:hypothetical protein
MTLASILIVAAALALIFLVRITVSAIQQRSAAGLVQQLEPIDLEAFRNLTDSVEEEYLRRRLPASEFRTVQRARLRAMAAYVRSAGRNAVMLVRIGQRALAGNDAETAQAARELVGNAVLLRRNATFVLFRIYVAMAWPNAGLAADPILHDYERLNGSAMLLGRLQHPASPGRISGVS